MSNRTEHNYSDKNDQNTEKEPNLFNNSITYDHIREKTKGLKDDDHPDYGRKHSRHSSGDNSGSRGDNSNNGDKGSKNSGGDSNTGENKNIMEEIMKRIDDGTLKSSETDEQWQYLANQEKTVAADKLYLFDKKQSNSHGDGHGHGSYNDEKPKSDYNSKNTHSESINDYMKKDQQSFSSHEQPQYNNYTPKASSYGPSYGDGPSMSYDKSLDVDKYEGFNSEEDLTLNKLEMLRKLGELVQHGVKLSQNYNMNSSYKTMKYEYDLHKSIRDKSNGVKWLSNLMLNACWGVELANDNFNPFEFKLEGWSEQMNEDVDDYRDVLGELYEKYFKAGKPIPPELKLVLMIGGSAVKFHIAHTALGKIPSLKEALQQNPGLASKLNEQTVNEKVKEQVKEQFKKQKETFDKKSDEQHEIATKRAKDLQMVKEKEAEFLKYQQSQTSNQTSPQQMMQQQIAQQQQMMQQQMMQQQILQDQMMKDQMLQQQLLDKQKQLEELKKQLSQQRSDTRSNYTNNSDSRQTNIQATMKAPTIPASLKNKFSLATNKPGLNANLATQNNKFNKIIDNHDNVSFDPNLDNIINNGFNDTQSRISNDSSNDSRASKPKKPRKKSSIKIDT